MRSLSMAGARSLLSGEVRRWSASPRVESPLTGPLNRCFATGPRVEGQAGPFREEGAMIGAVLFTLR